ncbi:tRNA guanosine-2-O-methyltransferase TRM13 [Trypanosoma grayi]|uniref:tRNA guanosine-2-O-methyltransferase TRM13 n=1 Tax=Trypanosoma grayi TaxID=71804 RepID=UPI0004F48ED2|nr:tRNA guanosine-2-O-methyltransferase TRM13 [Trypanosoma grayi]KEG12481.1 tRNA guanosine-2-O-methyltransferase TRM13 [Trypanosoma grayi]
MRCTVCNPWRGAFKCRRKQYHGVRAAAQFIASLLRSTPLSAPPGSSDVCHEQLADALLGVPSSLAHEGPLHSSHLTAFAALREGELVHMFGGAMPAELEAPPSRHVSELWSPALQQRYVRERLCARAAESKTAMPPRLEAGLAALRVFGNVEQRTPPVGDCSCDKKVSVSVKRELHEGDLPPEEWQARAQQWRKLIDAYTLMLPDRSPLHELENLPQEIAIGGLLSSALALLKETGGETNLRTIIDVGGGNGFLAAQLAERFKCESLIIDPFTPTHAIDNEEFLHWTETPRLRPRAPRRYPLHRITCRLPDVDWRSTSVEFDRSAMIAKHLCGTAIDVCLRHLHALEKLPRVVVVVPCCFNKGFYADYCNPTYLHDAASLNSDLAWNRWSRLTDWNRSCYQWVDDSFSGTVNAAGCLTCDTEGTRSRREGKKKVAHFLPCMDDVATMVEAVINHGRVLWLRSVGYHASTVEYVPRCVTPKNCAIVAVRRSSFRSFSLP